jgi:hypothetical protein
MSGLTNGDSQITFLEQIQVVGESVDGSGDQRWSNSFNNYSEYDVGILGYVHVYQLKEIECVYIKNKEYMFNSIKLYI